MTKTLLAAAVLAIAPTLSFAACQGYGHTDTAAMSCAEGSTYDAETQTCVPVVTG